MNNKHFKNLIKNTYELSKLKNNLIGILYNATQNYSFSQLINFDEFIETIKIDMLYLKSKLNNTEIDIYAWELEYYKIKDEENIICIKVKNKPEINIKY